jgi:hypothetical protein
MNIHKRIAIAKSNEPAGLWCHGTAAFMAGLIDSDQGFGCLRLRALLKEKAELTDDPRSGDVAVMLFNGYATHAAVVLDFPSQLVHRDGNGQPVVELSFEEMKNERGWPQHEYQFWRPKEDS